jgi:hypothetical protein
MVALGVQMHRRGALICDQQHEGMHAFLGPGCMSKGAWVPGHGMLETRPRLPADHVIMQIALGNLLGLLLFYIPPHLLQLVSWGVGLCNNFSCIVKLGFAQHSGHLCMPDGLTDFVGLRLPLQ